ncbi:MAG: DEAD/DEAH box helicase family protein [Candidatus Cloacimonetes bacterium]|nr:DEAD/DEAH box helicase family protein [Candidatus Cloacimonadota bacterium]
MFELKEYQNRALEALAEYLYNARLENDPDSAFRRFWRERGVDGVAYRTFELGNVPYVCLRLPTGGGKTVLASYAIETAARNYLFDETPLALWLVPTKVIQQQTLDALKTPRHPYRQAIDDYFGGRVSVFDVADVTTIRPQDLRDKVCIVVGTLASLRVHDTSGRKLYAHNENFETHFARIPHNLSTLERIEDGADKGKVKFSFANLCHLKKPLVILDEAHNARTTLSFETLKRLSPACIIEFTATPNLSRKNGSNLLYSVAASELKAEHMIKLPIMLTEHQTWRQAVGGAVFERNRLAAMTHGEKEYIRPIALYQAESKNREVTVEALKRYLMESENIPEEKIAVATGKQRELDGIDLFAPDCPIEHIITVQALKEGWDCSLAYVFCSVANIGSARDVEQLLGRVLRMPYANPRSHAELNCAYAHVSSSRFAQAANAMKDAMVNTMGFERIEAERYVEETTDDSIFDKIGDGKTEATTEIHVPQVDYDKLPQTPNVTVREEGEGYTVTVCGPLSEKQEKGIVKAVPAASRNLVQYQLHQHKRKEQRRRYPVYTGQSIRVPSLMVNIQGELQLWEPDTLLDDSGWKLSDFPAVLDSFSLKQEANRFELDIDNKRVIIAPRTAVDELFAEDVSSEWTDTGFIRWLDREARQQDVMQIELIGFLSKLVHHLIHEKSIPLAHLVQVKHLLVHAIKNQIDKYRQEVRERGYQQVLFGDDDCVEVTFDYPVIFDMEAYPPGNRNYDGSYTFQKHFYPYIVNLKSEGEEFICAQAIDLHPNVKHWIRNLERNDKAFWLPTSTDRFYPDFIAELVDGRILVIEYKGNQLLHTPDTIEKKTIGEFWAEKSRGKGVFLLATVGNINEQIDKAIN